MARKEVTKFLVVPPSDTEEVDGSFKSGLRNEFPGCEFELAAIPPLGSESFQVIPVMGTIGGGKSEMREKPEQWLLDDILQVCRRFEVSKVKRRAS